MVSIARKGTCAQYGLIPANFDMSKVMNKLICPKTIELGMWKLVL
jgi:hypothetical protein